MNQHKSYSYYDVLELIIILIVIKIKFKCNIYCDKPNFKYTFLGSHDFMVLILMFIL